MAVIPDSKTTDRKGEVLSEQLVELDVGAEKKVRAINVGRGLLPAFPLELLLILGDALDGAIKALAQLVRLGTPACQGLLALQLLPPTLASESPPSEKGLDLAK